MQGCSRKRSGAPHTDSRVNQWFNTACFTQPTNYTFGNESRVDFSAKSEGEDNFDVSINKSFGIAENTKLKFSTEISDLFNHAQFATPNDVVGSGSFGEVTSQRNMPRTIQFAMRLHF